ncbi:hypothetical protein B0E54_01659 [Micromonospora sp. MH99]|nr:hypothetical protein [Micromonospora sp. MH99]
MVLPAQPVLPAQQADRGVGRRPGQQVGHQLAVPGQLHRRGYAQEAQPELHRIAQRVHGEGGRQGDAVPAQPGHLRQRLIRRVRHGAQQLRQPTHGRGDRLVEVQVGVEVDSAVDPVCVRGQADEQVEVGEAALGGHRPEGDPAGLPLRHTAVGHGRQHLEQRVHARIADRPDLLHHPRVRGLLMGVRLADRAVHPADEVAHARVATGVHPQHQHRGEAADQRLQVGARPAGGGHPEQQVVLAGRLSQQGGQPGEDHCVDCRAGAAGQPREGCRHLGVDGERQAPATVGLHRRPGAVRWQRRAGRRRGEPFPPVRQVTGQFPLRLRPAAGGDVRDEPGGQRGQPGRHVGRELAVPAHQLLDEHACRPGVEDDVVRGHQQQVFVGGEGEQPDGEQRPAGEVEGDRRVRGDLPDDRRLPLGLRQRRQVDYRKRHLQGVRHPLGDDAVDGREHDPQRVVPGHDRVDRPVQRRDVQGAGDPLGEGHVVDRRARLQPVQEPELLLGEGERVAGRSAARSGRRHGGVGAAGGGLAGTALAQPQGQQLPLLGGEVGEVRVQVLGHRVAPSTYARSAAGPPPSRRDSGGGVSCR